MHGKGTYWFPNGNVYDGQWKQSYMEGFGVMNFNTGEVYEGEWFHGVMRKKIFSFYCVIISSVMCLHFRLV